MQGQQKQKEQHAVQQKQKEQHAVQQKQKEQHAVQQKHAEGEAGAIMAVVVTEAVGAEEETSASVSDGASGAACRGRRSKSSNMQG